MLNYLWAFMILAGILWAAFHGTMPEVTKGALNAAGEAVSLCVTMLGVISLWTGILKVGEKAGLIDQLAKRMRPILRFLFPNLPPDHPAARSIAANMIANILGLGWAATPAGLKAMEELAQLEQERQQEKNCRKTAGNEKKYPVDIVGNEKKFPAGVARNEKKFPAGITGNERKFLAGIAGNEKKFPAGIASNEMCTFLIINISSLQLIPVNMIAYRSQYGSSAPTAIIGPAIAATAASTAAAVIFCRIMGRRERRTAGRKE